jgi:succinate dehydrogenase / fumarate reductase cytochrome b subunit
MLLWVPVLMSLVGNEPLFSAIRDGLATPVGRLLLWLWIYAFLFHLCHGVRHLIWDAGAGYQREHMTRYASFELLASASLLVSLLAASLFLS